MIKVLEDYKIDIPVLLIFFARPEKTKQVFNAIKLARPSKLYLYQDGAREGRADDVVNVEKCREVVSDIDWKCEVHYKYQEQNYGCDPSEFIAQKWMFEKEEYGIILEDDDVPSQSFFPYCKELLEKYKNDTRFGIICGMNNLGVSEDCEDSYFFAQSGSIWGWATWKHNIDQWDENYSWLDNPILLKKLEKVMSKVKFNTIVDICKKHRASGKAHYESILGAHLLLNNKLNIIPQKNMISNIGIGENGTHAASDISVVPKRIRSLLYMKTYELTFPLKHPQYVIRDVSFEDEIYKILGIGHPILRNMRVLESVFYRVMKGDFKSVLKGIKRRF